MTALPADVAFYTSSGVLVITDPVAGAAIKALDPYAKEPTGEIEMFFDDPADAQTLLNEKFALLNVLNPLHEGVEVAESFGLGSTIALTPTVPSVMVVDDSRGIALAARVLAYGHDLSTDRVSVELLQ